MRARYWVLIVLLAWLLLDPRGLAGCLYTLGSSLGTFRSAMNH